MKKCLNEPLICEDYIRYIDWNYEEHSDIDIDDYNFEETKYPEKSQNFFKKYFCCCLKY